MYIKRETPKGAKLDRGYYRFDDDLRIIRRLFRRLPRRVNMPKVAGLPDVLFDRCYEPEKPKRKATTPSSAIEPMPLGGEPPLSS